MSPIDFKKCQCRMSLSLIFFIYVPCHCPMMSLHFASPCRWRCHLGSRRPVKFMKPPCRPIEFKGRGPLDWRDQGPAKKGSPNDHMIHQAEGGFDCLSLQPIFHYALFLLRVGYSSFNPTQMKCTGNAINSIYILNLCF